MFIDTMMLVRLLKFIAVISGLLLAAGCAAVFPAKKVDMTESSYKAAELLLQQSKAALTPQTSLTISPLTDINNPGELTAFGRLVSQQIGARFVQLGYNVTSATGDEAMIQREQAYSDATPQPQENFPPYGSSSALIAGQYAVANKQVVISLRLNDSASGKVVGAYDYELPYDRDIKELTKTKADRESFFPF